MVLDVDKMVAASLAGGVLANENHSPEAAVGVYARILAELNAKGLTGVFVANQVEEVAKAALGVSIFEREELWPSGAR